MNIGGGFCFVFVFLKKRIERIDDAKNNDIPYNPKIKTRKMKKRNFPIKFRKEIFLKIKENTLWLQTSSTLSVCVCEKKGIKYIQTHKRFFFPLMMIILTHTQRVKIVFFISEKEICFWIKKDRKRKDFSLPNNLYQRQTDEPKI